MDRAIGLIAVTASLCATQAIGQTTPATGDFSVSGGADIASDYRFRGLSQTDKNIAIQGTAIVTHASGLYLSAWGSSIDDYVANGADAELDLIAGYGKTIGGTKIDGGLLYYVYPGHGAARTNFFEPYLNASRSVGPVAIKLGANLAWHQRALGFAGDRRGGIYAYGELSAPLAKTGVALTGHLGRSFTRNYITFYQRYTDVSVGAAYTWQHMTLGASFIDTDHHFQSYPAGGGRNREIGRSGAVVSAGVTF